VTVKNCQHQILNYRVVLLLAEFKAANNFDLLKRKDSWSEDNSTACVQGQLPQCHSIFGILAPCNFIFGVESFLVVQSTVMHLHTWPAAV
jgi:hypothetical protein